MTFSVTKTFLTTVVGVLLDRGSITNVTDRAATFMPPGVDLFADPHNAPITWEHLLRQTSDWSGRAVGQARLGRSAAAASDARAVEAARDARARHALQVQRHPRERPGAGCAVTSRNSRCRICCGLRSWRRSAPRRRGTGERTTTPGLHHRRQADEVGHRWRPLRRRDVHQLLGPGAVRLSVSAARPVERQAADLRKVDRDGAHAGACERRLRVRQLVPQPRRQVDAVAADVRASPSRATVRTSCSSTGTTIWSSSCGWLGGGTRNIDRFMGQVVAAIGD